MGADVSSTFSPSIFSPVATPFGALVDEGKNKEMAMLEKKCLLTEPFIEEKPADNRRHRKGKRKILEISLTTLYIPLALLPRFNKLLRY